MIALVGSPRANGLALFTFTVGTREQADHLIAHPEHASPPCDWVHEASGAQQRLDQIDGENRATCAKQGHVYHVDGGPCMRCGR